MSSAEESNPYAAPGLDSEASSERTPPSTVRYRVMLWLTLAAALAYLVRGAVSVAESTIRNELHLSLSQAAWFMGAFFWSYALCQVPAGWLAQRYGTRRMLALFAAAWSLAALLIGVSHSFWMFVAAQLLMGIAQAGIFPAACNSIAKWMPLSRRSLSCAVLATGMQVGAIGASLLTGSLVGPLGWRPLFMLYALPGLIWAIWFWLRFHNEPQRDPHVNAGELAIIAQASDRRAGLEESSVDILPTPWWKLLQHSTLWFLCGQQICRAAGYMFFASWFPTFLQKTRGVSIDHSGYLQALVFGGTLLGSLCGGLVTDWIWRRTSNLRLSRSGVGSAALALCGLLILSAWFVENVTLAVLLMAAGSYCAALAGPCAFSATIDVGGRHVPQVFGLMNMAGNFAAALCPLAVGALFSWTSNWDLVLLLFAAVYLCGAASWLLVDPRKKV